MGDFADMALEAAMDDLGPDLSGHWDYDYDWEEGPMRRRSWRHGPAVKTCYHCGQGHLTWRQMSDGTWRLHMLEGQLHSCLSARDPAADFRD